MTERPNQRPMNGYATRRSLLRRMLAILTSALLVLLLAGIGLTYVAQSTERANDAALAAMVDTRSGRDLLALLVESESAHRSLLLTQDASYLEPLERAQRELPGTRQRFADALRLSGHQADATRVAEAVDARLAFEAETLRLERTGQREEALRAMSGGESQRLMDAVRMRVGASELHQDARLHHLLAETHQAAASFAVMLLGAVLVLFILLIAGLGTTRSDLMRLDVEERALIDHAKALESHQSALKTMVETSADVVRLVGMDGRLLLISGAVFPVLGYTAEEALALPKRSLIPAEDAATVAVEFDRSLQRGETPAPFVHRLRCKNGELKYFETHTQLHRDDAGVVRWYTTSSRDVTETRAQMDNMAALERETEVLKLASSRDPLTELLNRRGFMETAEPLLATLHAEGRHATLMFADLDGLKAINDSFGHDAGDEAITLLAKLLVKTFRATDVLARLGGDEFLVLAVDADAARGVDLRTRLMGKIAARNEEHGHRFALGVSIGLVHIDPSNPRPLAEVITDADAAMYALKRRRTRDRATLI